MSRRVKIFGAGSIGNHLAQASRRAGWDVVIVDPDKAALERTKNEIYPMRYGSWDDGIELAELGKEAKGDFDVIYLGTPPHVRMDLALQMLSEKPKVLQLEKPLCSPKMEKVESFVNALESSGVMAIVGYDHAISKASRTTEELIKRHDLGKPLTVEVEFRETWKGIFAAHPWLSGPSDTYLGFWKRGGGASGEHSHATHLWQHFVRVLGLGEVAEVNANMQMVQDQNVDYDRASFLNLTTDSGFVGRVVQDVVTEPVKKQVFMQFERGYVIVDINGWEKGDVVRLRKEGEEEEVVKIEKSRPDDFYEEIKHIDDLLEGKTTISESPLAFDKGLSTMEVVRAAHESRQEGRSIKVK